MTVVEVAERAGVPLGTMSRVMNNDIHVAMKREMRYVANLAKAMVLILPRNLADYMGILKNANFPFVLIDHHQGTGSLCPVVSAQYAKPGEEPGGVDYAGYRLPVCALGDAGGEPRACRI